MARRCQLIALAVFAISLRLSATPAHADAIDGNWCHGEDGRFSISGPRIVTPGGTSMSGDYGRHAFSYVVPAAEPGAGATVSMILINDEILHLIHPTAPAGTPPQIWHRCPADIS